MSRESTSEILDRVMDRIFKLYLSLGAVAVVGLLFNLSPVTSGVSALLSGVLLTVATLPMILVALYFVFEEVLKPLWEKALGHRSYVFSDGEEAFGVTVFFPLVLAIVTALGIWATTAPLAGVKLLGISIAAITGLTLFSIFANYIVLLVRGIVVLVSGIGRDVRSLGRELTQDVRELGRRASGSEE